ncbi:hypothetical protein GW17_00043990 [Ensete ventricosum]|nr:hypothetical protein GW17_00043990 [Ensete ventricosum]
MRRKRVVAKGKWIHRRGSTGETSSSLNRRLVEHKARGLRLRKVMITSRKRRGVIASERREERRWNVNRRMRVEGGSHLRRRGGGRKRRGFRRTDDNDCFNTQTLMRSRRGLMIAVRWRRGEGEQKRTEGWVYRATLRDEMSSRRAEGRSGESNPVISTQRSSTPVLFLFWIWHHRCSRRDSLARPELHFR